LQELAHSIQASGVHQPILVRPLPAARLEETSRALRSSVLAWPFATTRKREPIEYELVAGERRWRACQLAGVAEIPAMIRELTDEQALEVQVVENLQREDVTELEEAEGYEVLMQHGTLNADQVAAKIGKSRSYVYARLKLLALGNTARNALREGLIDASKALLIARIPDEGLQIKALDFCTHADWQGDLPGYRECARHIQDEFMLRLDKAQFTITDATLLPEAGACGDCPKRTGANPDLFKDVDSADVCTDPKCYRAKEDAHTAQVVAAAQAKGQTVIAGDEAAELVYDNYNSKLKGYRRLDSVDDSPTDKPLRSIIGQQMEAEGIKPTMIANPRKRSELLACLPNEVVLRLLKAVEGQAKATKEVAAEVKELVKTKEAKALEKAKAKYEQAWRDRLLDLAWAQIEGQMPYQFTADVHRYLLRREINSLSQEDAAALANILNLGKVGAHNALQDFAQTTRSPDQLHLLVIMQRDSGASHYAYGRPKNEGLMLVAGIALGDGLETAVKDSQAIAAAEHLPKAPAEATTGTKQADEPSAQPADAKAPSAKKPAALARSNARAKKPSAAAEAPKVSPQYAAANIAAALAELEEGNSEGAAAEVPAALAQLEEGQDVAPTAQGNEAPPAPAGGDAPQPDQPAGGLRVGVEVRIKPNATGKKQAPHIGKQGTVLRQIGPDAWDVSIPREKRGVPLFVCFHTTELEVL
ncbi:MAG: ParB/RepB/Spo0J family partition protein, partial [Acidovorax temperans]|uniref:ParB/RepB/Spo0J family partition protein n=1 Tax=Acidovorax temperans TaxID=80878 RepID=UPI003918D26A